MRVRGPRTVAVAVTTTILHFRADDHDWSLSPRLLHDCCRTLQSRHLFSGATDMECRRSSHSPLPSRYLPRTSRRAHLLVSDWPPELRTFCHALRTSSQRTALPFPVTRCFGRAARSVQSGRGIQDRLATDVLTEIAGASRPPRHSIESVRRTR